MTYSTTGETAAAAAADVIRNRIGKATPVAAIVLGSGLGTLAARIANQRSIAYDEIPGFFAARVAGHRGELIRGTLGGKEVLALSGRFHIYEGHTPAAAAFPVRVARALGARVLFASNAAGGVRRTLKPGDLMVIDDHINLLWRNPLVGPTEPGDLRFPDMSAPYSPRLRELLHACGRAKGIALTSGVYAGLLGPSYETPAEIRMLETMGADAVGMSTVPEAIMAAAIGMEAAGVSVITNVAAGMSAEPVSHAEVVTAGAAAAERLGDLVTEFVARL